MSANQGTSQPGSWSVGAFGRKAAVQKSIAQQFASQAVCAQPCEAIRQAVLILISAALATHPDNCALRLQASGSQVAGSGNTWLNGINISIDPQRDFLE